MTCSVDDAIFEFYINNQRLYFFEGLSFSETRIIDISKHLTTGNNTIAFKCKNTLNVAMLQYRIYLTSSVWKRL